MEAEEILRRMRTVVMVVDGYGMISNAEGGFGGFLGYDVAKIPGTSVFDYVAPDHIDELVVYFAESAATPFDTASLPLPFRVMLIDADGFEQPVDVVPSGFDDGGDLWSWVVVVVPVEFIASVIRPLEAEMSGAPRHEVMELLTEELAIENEHYCNRWFLVDLRDADAPSVVTARTEDQQLAEVIGREAHDHGWAPWRQARDGDTAPLMIDELPTTIQALLAARQWRRASITPVYVDGQLTACYLLFGRVPDGYDNAVVNTNVRDRFGRLVAVTTLLFTRWRDQDRLVAAATRDPLTGLANRDALADALAVAGTNTAVLYIDVDHFKTVNDRHGHDVGDRVLVEIADRIVSACRPVDVVARFGGDEFVVLLHDVDQRAAEEIAERVVGFVSAPMYPSDGLECVSVSVGLARIGDRDDPVDAADRAMLQAKRGGRGHLVTSEAMTLAD